MDIEHQAVERPAQHVAAVIEAIEAMAALDRRRRIIPHRGLTPRPTPHQRAVEAEEAA